METAIKLIWLTSGLIVLYLSVRLLITDYRVGKMRKQVIEDQKRFDQLMLKLEHGHTAPPVKQEERG